MKWEKVNLEGKKTFESISNNLSELRQINIDIYGLYRFSFIRIIAGKKDQDFNLYSNICQDIIHEKSSEVINLLNSLGERLTILVEFLSKNLYKKYVGKNCECYLSTK